MERKRDAVALVRAELGIGIVFADGFDFLIEKLQSQRHSGVPGEKIDDATAYGELAARVGDAAAFVAAGSE